MHRFPLLSTLAFVCLVSNPVVAAVSDPELEKILERYVEELGGNGRIAELNSVKYEGTLMDDGELVADVIIVQKQPNLARITMQKGTRKITMAFDGNNIWMRKYDDDTLTRGNAISEEQGYNLVREADFINPLVNFLSSTHTYKLIGEEKISGGIETYVIEVTRAKVPGIERFYIGKKDYLLRKRMVHYKDKGAEKEVESIYGDYQTVNGVKIAYKLTTWIDGERQQVLQWDRVEPNKGIFDTYFKEPPR